MIRCNPCRFLEDLNSFQIPRGHAGAAQTDILQFAPILIFLRSVYFYLVSMHLDLFDNISFNFTVIFSGRASFWKPFSSRSTSSIWRDKRGHGPVAAGSCHSGGGRSDDNDARETPSSLVSELEPGKRSQQRCVLRRCQGLIHSAKPHCTTATPTPH